MPNHLTPLLLRPTSPQMHYDQFLTYHNQGIYTSPLHMPELSQFQFPHLVLHKSHSHHVSNILISNLISPSMFTYPPQYPHLLIFWI
uniref:Putative ovule protein n=1 Tax=Solanum chacoense TaxID=4108 RepID=A0A0V0HK21_SOLCH